MRTGTSFAPFRFVRRKDLLWLPALLLCLGTCAEAQTIITASRRIDWSQAGVIGGIPNRTAICATLNPGATATQINAAIASCGSGQVVFLNAGTYTLSSGIRFNNKRDVTLRGAGPDQTFLVFSAGSSCGGMGADVCFINGDGNWTGEPRNLASMDEQLCDRRRIDYVERHDEFESRQHADP